LFVLTNDTISKNVRYSHTITIRLRLRSTRPFFDSCVLPTLPTIFFVAS